MGPISPWWPLGILLTALVGLGSALVTTGIQIRKADERYWFHEIRALYISALNVVRPFNKWAEGNNMFQDIEAVAEARSGIWIAHETLVDITNELEVIGAHEDMVRSMRYLTNSIEELKAAVTKEWPDPLTHPKMQKHFPHYGVLLRMSVTEGEDGQVTDIDWNKPNAVLGAHAAFKAALIGLKEPTQQALRPHRRL